TSRRTDLFPSGQMGELQVCDRRGLGSFNGAAVPSRPFPQAPFSVATCIGSMKKGASYTGAHAPATNMTSAVLAFLPFVPRARPDVRRLTQWSAFLVVLQRRSSVQL